MGKQVKEFYDEYTFTLTYVVYDDQSKDAVIIDPVLDYNPASGALSTKSVDEVLEFVKAKDLNVSHVLETHAHADHLSGAIEIKRRIPEIKVAIGEHITKVQEVFKGVFNFKEMKTDGSQFDVLLNEDNILKAGTIEVKTIFTPGHTPACSSYLIEDMVFTGDAIFMPDFGTGRCDFPAGNAKDLYHSVHNKLYELPDETRVYTGHDYPKSKGREMQFESTIGAQKKGNIQLKETTTEDEFVEMRTTRDSGLAAPRLLLPSVQVNINAGELPPAEDNGVQYLKMPIKS